MLNIMRNVFLERDDIKSGGVFKISIKYGSKQEIRIGMFFFERCHDGVRLTLCAFNIGTHGRRRINQKAALDILHFEYGMQKPWVRMKSVLSICVLDAVVDLLCHSIEL
jgi:hypothetical protein